MQFFSQSSCFMSRYAHTYTWTHVHGYWSKCFLVSSLLKCFQLGFGKG